MEELIQLGLGAILFGLAYLFGTRIESEHYRDIKDREQRLLNLPVVTGKVFLEARPVLASQLVCGNVVISGDFFKSVVSDILSLFGMRIAVAESLVDRARREAVLRLKEKVPDADMILNLRIETMRIGERGQLSGVEAMAYGTAIYYQK